MFLKHALASIELRTRASGKDGGSNMSPGCQLHVSAIAVANRRYTTEVLWRRCRLVKDELSPGSANRELAGCRLMDNCRSQPPVRVAVQLAEESHSDGCCFESLEPESHPQLPASRSSSRLARHLSEVVRFPREVRVNHSRFL